MKTCTKCGETKELSEFYKDKSRKDGLTHRCKECKREDNRESHQANRDKRLEAKREYREQNRERVREANREHYQQNREHLRERNREWHQQNREHRSEYIREWRQNNPEKRRTYNATRRVRKRGNLTPTDLQQSADYRKMLEGTPCHYCGRTDGPFHVDHKQPISRGGDDHWTNLVQACENCNLTKHDKTYEEFTGTPDLTHYCVQR